MKRITFLCGIILGFNYANAQEIDFVTGNNKQKVEIKINGLACPFCAFGLEKKLTQINGISDLIIDVEKGMAQFKIKDGVAVPVYKIKDAVTQAGFTPGQIQLINEE